MPYFNTLRLRFARRYHKKPLIPKISIVAATQATEIAMISGFELLFSVGGLDESDSEKKETTITVSIFDNFL